MWRAIALAVCLTASLAPLPARGAGETVGGQARTLGEAVRSLCEPAGLRWLVDGELAELPVTVPGRGVLHERLDAVCACISGAWWSQEGRAIAVGRRPDFEPRQFFSHLQAQRLSLLAAFADALSAEEREALRQGIGIAFGEMSPAARAAIESDVTFFGPIAGEPMDGTDLSEELRDAERVLYTRWEDRAEFYAHPSDVTPLASLERVSPWSSGLIRFNTKARRIEGTPWFVDAYLDRNSRQGLPIPPAPRRWQPGDQEPEAPDEAGSASEPQDGPASAILPFGLLPLRDICETLSRLGIPMAAAADVEAHTVFQPGGDWGPSTLADLLEPVLRLRPRQAARGLVFESVPLTGEDYRDGVAPELSARVVAVGSRIAGDSPGEPDLARHKLADLPAETRRELLAIYRWWASNRGADPAPPDPAAAPNMEVRLAPTLMVGVAWFRREADLPREFDEGPIYTRGLGIFLEVQ